MKSVWWTSWFFIIIIIVFLKPGMLPIASLHSGKYTNKNVHIECTWKERMETHLKDANTHPCKQVIIELSEKLLKEAT